MEFKISAGVATKLRDKHQVSQQEVVECFYNKWGRFFTDTRLEHQTDPPTYWFISETDKNRRLKVVFIRHPDLFEIKSAFPPELDAEKLYEDLCQKYPLPRITP